MPAFVFESLSSGIDNDMHLVEGIYYCEYHLVVAGGNDVEDGC